MAPSVVHEDDFIFTLSDRESDHGEEDDLSDGLTLAQQSKKRKRDVRSTKQPKRAKRQKAQKEAVDELSESDTDPEDAGEQDGAIDPDFEFEVGGYPELVEDFDGWDASARLQPDVKKGDKKAVDVDDIIQRRRQKREGLNGTSTASVEASNGVEAAVSDTQESEVESEGIGDGQEGFEGFDNDDDELLAPDGFGMGVSMETQEESGSDKPSAEEGRSDDESVASPVAHPDDLASGPSPDDENEDEAEKEKKAAFFAPEEENTKDSPPSATQSFQNFSLSRPILRGIAAVGFTAPTPIQQKTIPVALLGKDVVGGAVTGSGKTAAFIIPILERLLYRPRKHPMSRVVILMPTRELAVQCYNVATKLASFTDITFGQAIGGLNSREQENVLKKRPDIIIATPGRFIDHMRNSANFAVDAIEILVLDEADRMLETGFADELNEILTTIPKSRQTMLFSATMTDSVDKLIRVGLNRPVRLLVDAKNQTVGSLVQEFIRLRPGREDKRLGHLILLCNDVYTERVIIFFRQKKEAHRARIVFGLLGLKAAELHGSMSQEQRIRSVENFRDGKASFLLATDVASRGLDIKGVETVINYEAPQSHEIYLHRVGRTARAGRAGRACTIAAEPDRKVVKAAVKSGRAHGAKIVSRIINPGDADKWASKIEALQQEIEAILKEEKEERQLAQAEMQVTRGENIITHQDEIMARPKRTWFESEKEKQAAKNRSKAELDGALPTKKEKRKLSGKEKKRLDDSKERKERKMWKKGKGDGSNGARGKQKKSSKKNRRR